MQCNVDKTNLVAWVVVSLLSLVSCLWLLCEAFFCDGQESLIVAGCVQLSIIQLVPLLCAASLLFFASSSVARASRGRFHKLGV